MESIVTSVKKLLGIAEDYNHFDIDIIIHINTALMALTQMGIGPVDGFVVKDASDTWDDFLSENDKNLEAVKTYVYMKVKLVFDPPLSSAVIESINRCITELEWRLNLAAESTNE